MSNSQFSFDHIHITSEDPKAAALWYQEMFGADITKEYELRGAPQIHVELGAATLIIRGKRPGETPATARSIEHFENFSSHNTWGTDHFGFAYEGDLGAFCEEIRNKGVKFAIEPWEFSPGTLLCYVAGPDGVSIELIQRKI